MYNLYVSGQMRSSRIIPLLWCRGSGQEITKETKCGLSNMLVISESIVGHLYFFFLLSVYIRVLI